jgi:hypothetical protein
MRCAIQSAACLLLAAALVAWPRPADAAVTLRLTISPTTIAFPSGDPDTTPLLTAPAITVTYGIWDRNSNDYWTLTVQAAGDLTSGTATIPASGISWTATPAPPFRNGVLSSTLAQPLATAQYDVRPETTGTVVFSLANSWSYNVGTYSQNVVFTLTSQ